MSPLLKKLATLFLPSIICSSLIAKETAPYIENITNGKSYYHLMYTLTKDNLVSVDKLSKKQFYEDGGQFSIQLRKDNFPIPAPNCKANLILRMPWVESNDSLSNKYKLYENIISLYNNKNDKRVNVAVELNPYLSFNENGIYLTNCNIYFRHKNGNYINNIKP